MKTTLLLTLIVATGCAGALHRTAQVSEVLALGSLACDAGSTDTAVRGGYTEQNPIMGPSPGTGEVVGYFTTVGAGVVALNAALPDWARVAGNVVLTALEVRAERGNYAQGDSTCGIGSR